MAVVSRRAAPSVDASTAMYAGQISGLVAGENIAVGDTCTISAASGRVMRSTSSAANFAGIAAREARVGEPLTVYNTNCRVGYADTLTPGARYWISVTAGRLDDTAVAGVAPVALAINATDILITRAG